MSRATVVRRLIVVSLLSVVALCACAPGAQATVPGKNGKIAFVFTASLWGTIYTVNPDGSNLTQLTTSPAEERDPAWSPDGAKIVFSRRESSSAEGRLWVMDADGGNRQQLTFDDGGPFHNDVEAAWSPDGTKIAFVRNFLHSDPPCSELYEINPDGTGLHQLASTPHCHEEGLVWSPDGSKLAYASIDDNLGPLALYVANADNTNPTQIAQGLSPSWAPGGNWIAYYNSSGTFITTPDGTTTRFLRAGADPEWSPDGKRIAINGLYTFDTAGGSLMHIPGTNSDDVRPAWQPLPPPPPPDPGYPRPRGASPLVVPLVPAFKECTSSNTVHGPPLVSGSCTPPVQASRYATVGTPDANGERANSTGFVRIAAVAGNPSTAANEADISLSAEITDVRCKDLNLCDSFLPPDYAGALTAVATLQLTDRDTGGTSNDPATSETQQVSPVLILDTFRFEIPCDPTDDPTVGSTCREATTLNALIPGAVKEGKRSIWALGQVQVYDGGVDGDPTTSPNTLFEDQGIFVP